jgi:hypothetical protein
MLVCTYHTPTKPCFCGQMTAKSLGDCEVCTDGGSGICTDHTCYKNIEGQEFPITFVPKTINPDTGELVKA